MSITRREFARSPWPAHLPSARCCEATSPRRQSGRRTPALSRWAGVQVGLNVPYSLGTGNNIAAEDLLKRVVEVGVGGLELRAQPVEHFLGSPTVRAAAEAAKAREAARAAGTARRRRSRWRQGGQAGGRATQTPEQVEAARKLAADDADLAPGGAVRQAEGAAAAVREGRRVDRHPEGRRPLHGLRRGSRLLLPDGARPRRASGLGGAADGAQRHASASARSPTSTRSSWPITITPRPARRGTRRSSPRRATTAPTSTSATGRRPTTRRRCPSSPSTPIAFPHIHVKDRRLGTNGGENTPFGQGDTQVRPILQAIRDNKWNIRPIIEFEYRVPEGSDRVDRDQEVPGLLPGFAGVLRP